MAIASSVLGLCGNAYCSRSLYRPGHPIRRRSSSPHLPRAAQVAEHDLRVVDGVELALRPEPIPSFVYGLTRPEDITFAEGKLTPHPWCTMTQPLRLRDADRLAAIPRPITNCTATLAGRPDATPPLARR